MKYWFLLLTIALTGFACTNQKACTGKNYFVKTDTTKPYMVKGAYCIAGNKRHDCWGRDGSSKL